MFEALGSPHANSLRIRFDQSPLHLCICVCVVTLLAVCFSHLHNRKKTHNSFLFPPILWPSFSPCFSPQGFVCLSSFCACFHAFCFIALKGNAPEHPALLIPHTQTQATGLIQRLCGRPSGVACKYSRDESAADENVPSALWIGWTRISVACRDRSACLNL